MRTVNPVTRAYLFNMTKKERAIHLSATWKMVLETRHYNEDGSEATDIEPEREDLFVTKREARQICEEGGYIPYNF